MHKSFRLCIYSCRQQSARRASGFASSRSKTPRLLLLLLLPPPVQSNNPASLTALTDPQHQARFRRRPRPAEHSTTLQQHFCIQVHASPHMECGRCRSYSSTSISGSCTARQRFFFLPRMGWYAMQCTAPFPSQLPVVFQSFWWLSLSASGVGTQRTFVGFSPRTSKSATEHPLALSSCSVLTPYA